MAPPKPIHSPYSFLRLLILAVVVYAILAPSANAAPLFGFNDGGVAFNQISATADAKLAKGAGSTADNIVVSWRDVEGTKGKYSFGMYDEIYNARVAQGIKPIFTVAFAPKWAWAPGIYCSGDCRYPPAPQFDANWKAFITTLAKRYPKLSAIQVWNEPNLTAYWRGSAVDPARYTALVKAANAAVKTAGSTIPVLAGALANVGTSATGMDYRTFLKGMYAAGLKGNHGGLSLHPYPDDVDLWAFYRTISDVREIRDQAGDSSAKLWLTETGVSTTDPANKNFVFDESSQAAMLTRLVTAARAMPDVAAVVLHTLIEPTQFPTDNREYGFGVVHRQPGFAPKPAYCALAKLNATGYACPAGVTSAAADAAQEKRWTAQDLLQTAADAARAFRAQTGSYYGLTPAALNSNSGGKISTTMGSLTQLPGTSADPSRMVIWAPTAGAAGDLWLCNTSTADRSYCIWLTPDRAWTYGMADGPVEDASRATLRGWCWWW